MNLLRLLFISILLSACSKDQTEHSSIIPQAQEVIYETSYFNMSEFKLYANEQALSTSKLFVNELAKLNYLTDSILPFIDPIKAKSINLLIDSSINTNKEYYELAIKQSYVLIKGASREGLIHGIYTFLQLIPRSSGIDDSKIACLNIQDYPEFKWRGLLLDCSRHFMDIDFVKRYIDLLAYHKMNVLHWHLTEDQGWRIEIKQYPKLTEIGSLRKQKDGTIYGGYYTQDQIKALINYAHERGITIVPEIELPGHSLAALAAHPEYSCTGGPFEVENDWGVFKDIYCAGNDSTFTFLENILSEVIELFPSEYIHIGGDESPKYRWENCNKCQQRISMEGLQDEHELQSYFIQRIENYLKSKGKKLIGWDEILEGGLAEGATVQSWRGFEGAAEAAKTGHDAIVSPTSHAYFDYALDAIDLEQVYAFNPIPEGLTEKEQKHIIGGECNMWTERAPQETVDSKVFPRIIAMAEVLWTYPEVRNYDLFYDRVQKHYKRLDVLNVDYGLETTPVGINSTFINNQFNIELIAGAKNTMLEYQLNNQGVYKYDSTIVLNGTNTIKAWALKNKATYGEPIDIKLYQHKGLNANISDLNEYDNAYSGGGDNCISDGIRGSTNFRDGKWQGYFGKDFTATLKFDQLQMIDTVATSFFQYNLSWIFMPTKISIYTSTDGESYFNRAVYYPEISPKKEGQFFEEFILNFSEVEAKYVKIKAENFGICPDWHPAAGSDAWLFIDEVRIY